MGEHRHTATPWRVFLYGGVQIGHVDGAAICSMWGDKAEGEANAAFIVKAVNCHDELVNALKAARPFLAISDDQRASGRLKLVEAAIAKAEGSSK